MNLLPKFKEIFEPDELPTIEVISKMVNDPVPVDAVDTISMIVRYVIMHFKEGDVAGLVEHKMLLHGRSYTLFTYYTIITTDEGKYESIELGEMILLDNDMEKIMPFKLSLKWSDFLELLNIKLKYELNKI